MTALEQELVAELRDKLDNLRLGFLASSTATVIHHTTGKPREQVWTEALVEALNAGEVASCR